jgi:phage baseplate assembly protein W
MSEVVETYVEWEDEVELDSISITLTVLRESVLPLAASQASTSELIAFSS